jgi:hypothetical protein
MNTPPTIGTLGIGAAGELLVQYLLLKHGIDSARLTTDSGIDLVMYVAGNSQAATIQVKAVLEPKPGTGNSSRPVFGLGFPDSCKAQWLAGVDLSRDRVWLFRIDEARKLAQQHRPNGVRALYWHVETTERKGVAYAESDMDPYRLSAVAAHLLASESVVLEGDS